MFALEPAGRGRVEIPGTADHCLCTSPPLGLRRGCLLAFTMLTGYTQKGLRPAWWGVVILFLVHGLVVSSWISRIPAVQTKLHISNGVLGLTLLSAAIGAVLTIPVVGYLVSRFGSKRVCLVSSVAF